MGQRPAADLFRCDVFGSVKGAGRLLMVAGAGVGFGEVEQVVDLAFRRQPLHAPCVEVSLPAAEMQQGCYIMPARFALIV